MSRIQRNVLGVVWLTAGLGCGLIGAFDEPVAEVCPTPGALQTRDNACGVCGTGQQLETCSVDNRWEATSCDDPLDRDGDGAANEACSALPGGCCIERLDCNDHAADVSPAEFDCTYREASAGEPDEEACTTSCDTAGRRQCTSACTWGDCTVDEDGCNGEDDDCDGETDEDATCAPGDTVDCTTSCGSTGTGTCTATCTAPTGAACEAPAETCDGQDEDCDGVRDNGYECIQGENRTCITTCGGELGTRLCGTDCTLPAACTPPAEVCNGVDDDCDTVADNGFSCVSGHQVECTASCGTTGSGLCTATCGVPAAGDCEPPLEACANEIDDDCDGETDELTAEQCVPGSPVACVTACDPAGERTGSGTCTAECVPPGPAECTPPVDEACNARDDNCDTVRDEGFDCVAGSPVSCTTACGSGGTGTCTAGCVLPEPAACAAPAEVCNGVDDNCNGVCDEGSFCCAGQTATCTSSCGSAGRMTCSAACAWGDCTPPVEACNGLDDDCDTAPDNGFACVRGTPVECTTGCGTLGSGMCTAACAAPTGATCTPPPEACNAVDDNCNGGTDEIFACVRGATVSCTTTCGTVGSGVCTSACVAPVPASCNPPAESCNGADDDCDGTADDGFACRQSSTGPCTVAGCSGTALCSGSCTWGTCTPGWAAPTTPPVLLAPENGERTGSHRAAGNLRPTFRWQAVTLGCGSTLFDLQVDDSCTLSSFRSCSFPSPEINQTGLTGSSYRPATGLAVRTAAPWGRRYYWRMRYCDVFSRCTGWSDVRYLDVGHEANDFNGDGYADVVIGASGAGTGTAYIYWGRQTSDWPIYNEPTSGITTIVGTSGMSYRAAAVGDVNGDGYADMLFGNGGGGAALYLGGNPFNTTVDLSLMPGGYSTGWAVGGAGDVNGDGYADFLVGEPHYQSGTTRVGRAYLYFGGATVNSTVDVTYTGGAPTSLSFDWWGEPATGIGDFNADGYSDVLVGVRDYGSGTLSGSGRALVFFGGGTPDNTADLTATGTAGGYHLGRAAGGVGDVNGDGISDLAIGVPGGDRVYLYFGSRTPDISIDLTITGTAGGSFGQAVAGMGDVNGDGFGDMMVGAPALGTNTGTAYLYPGATTPSGAYTEVLTGSSPEQLGYSVAGAGDVNGDGYADCLAGGPYANLGATTAAGHAELGFGAASPYWRHPQQFWGDAANDNFGEALGGRPMR